jgi:hypothetical protein
MTAASAARWNVDPCWPTDTFVDFEHGLNTAIKRLRDALGDSADAPRFVETLPRRGYRFIAPVETSSPHPYHPVMAAPPPPCPGLSPTRSHGGEERRLAGIGHRPRWSPDGTRLLCSAETGQQNDYAEKHI